MQGNTLRAVGKVELNFRQAQGEINRAGRAGVWLQTAEILVARLAKVQAKRFLRYARSQGFRRVKVVRMADDGLILAGFAS